ncbi:helix-turn-helix domain-containing protein [Mycoavidus sp. B2-EB]|uniref:helix-turn-helix domain-containing protein n=1 Tax=Mycoavidus sp. B2-EB TaxID=2651972 RepID=UPI0016237D5F|nr:helix-turn-helix domain-containing protein [Mycoavidus sp. B2-EB]BBO59456.1 helix-turn-helix domain-containing protein [Mycoavidus sp. B2-EB]
MSKQDEQTLKTESPATPVAAKSAAWAADDGSARVAGEQLAQLREANGWLIEEVAARLKVSVAKVRALEAGELEHLPEVTFAIGIMRSYAKILGTDPQPLVDALRRASAQDSPNLTTLSGRGRMPQQKLSTLRSWQTKRKGYLWLWGMGILALAAALLVYRYDDIIGHESKPQLSKVQPKSSVSEASAGAVRARLVLTNQATAGVVAQSPHLNAIPANPPAAAVPTMADARGQGNMATLRIKVSQNNWISVSQHDGQQVYANTVQAGGEQTLKGAPPFKIVVGNVAGLEAIELDGKRVEADKYAGGRQNVARFELP